MRLCLILALLVVLTFTCGICFADDPHNQVVGGDIEQSQAQDQDQYQGQSQVGVQGQKSRQANDQVVNVSSEDKTEVTTAVWPSTQSTSGKEERTVSSLFGSLGSNRTEEFIRIGNQLQVLEVMRKNAVLDELAYKEEVWKLYKQLQDANRPQKLLGVLPIAQRGCNLLNLCGLATW